MAELIKSVMEEVLQRHAEKPPGDTTQNQDGFFSALEEPFSTPKQSTPKQEKKDITADKKMLHSILKKQGMEFKKDKIIFPVGSQRLQYAQSTLDKVYNYIFDTEDRVNLPKNLKNAAKNIVMSWKNDHKNFSSALEKYPNLRTFDEVSDIKWESFD